MASLLLLGLLFPETARAQVEDCDCINCPQFLPDLSNTDFYTEIQNATNQTMGQNGQGLCGVRVHFDHTALCDLRITLTAPSGQSVVLIGPSFKHPDCFYLCTQGTSWDVTFLPCGDPDVAPDPGFSEQWTNVQVWGTNNFFTGSYYPFQGCLQNLTGPVNGTWTLNVFDGLGADVGNLISFELIFCDPTGINCFNCLAEAGNLNQPDVVVCARSQEAVLSLPPTYVPPIFAPPPADYSYGYVVANADGVIEGILPEPDLSGFPEGVYTVCGLSYHNLATPYLPAPDGVLTVQTLRDQLNALGPPFCGDISVNCVGVRIKPTPEDVEETATICGPECYEFFNQTFCQTGTYTLNLKEDGCSYTATLNLTVNPPSTTALSEVVCAPACSANPLFPQACATGTYTAYLENSLGCDSVVVLNLTVNAVQATIQDPPLLDCGVPSVVLSGAGSSSGSGVAYLWTATQGGHLVGAVDGINAVADSTGTYALQVCSNLSGLICCDTAIASVAGSTSPPPPPIALLGDALICLDSTASFSLAPVPGAGQYRWTADPVAHIDIASAGTTALVTAQDPGTFTLCVAAENACGSGPPVCLSVTVQGVPAASVLLGDTMACEGDTALYILGSLAGVQVYTWSVNGGEILFVSPGSDSLWVVWPDTGSVSVCVTPKGACGEGQAACREVQVLPIPEAHAGIDTAVCGLTLTLSALPGYPGVWESLIGGGAAVLSDSTAPDATATAPSAGDYRFAWRASNGVCAAADTVSVRFNPLPATGPVTITCDDTNTQYTVSFTVQQGTPPYAVPGGTMTGSVFTSDSLVSGVPYAFGVVDAQGCRAAPVQGIHSCICTSFAGEMDQDTLLLCAGETAIARHLGGAVQDGNDTTAYLLHSSSTTVVGMVYSMQASGAFGFQPGMQYGQTYYISLVVGNALNGLPDLSDPCLSVAPGQPVVFLEPPQAHAGMDTAVCGLSVSLSALTGAFPGVWSLYAGPGSLSFADSLAAGTTATASAAGMYAVVWSVANGQCVDTDTLQLQFNEAPSVVDLQHVCDGTNAIYTVVLSVTGGQPPYASTGLSGSFAGNTFTSDPLVSGSAFQLVVSDSRGCQADLSGQHVCGCTTFAGTLTAQDSVFCTTAPLRAQWDNNAVLDADDGIQFVLYAAAAGFPGGILAVNSAPEFFFGAGLQAGVPYIIAAVAGNLQGGSVSLSDSCLSVSPGVPVRWQEPPVVTLSGDTAVCAGSTALLTLSGSGVYSLSARLEAGSDTVVVDISSGQPLQLEVTPSATTVYRLLSVTGAGCTYGVVGQEVVVQVYALPVADAGADQVLRCDEPEVVLSGASSVAADTLKWYLGGQLVGSGATLVVRDPGLYALVAVHAAGCADTAWVRVTADVDVPTVGTVLVSGETCSGDGDGSILLEGVGGASPPILASLNGGPFVDQLYFGSLPPGVYTIRLRNSAGCLWQSDTLVVAPGTALSVSLGGDQEVSPGEVVVLQALVNGPADTLIWEPLLDSLQAQSGMQHIRPEESVLIRLRVRSPEGCEAFDEVFIRVRAVEPGAAVYVPNVIQPGSAFNDVFTVFAGPDVERVGVLRIFDRWGSIIFEALDMAPNDPSEGWDGRIRGVQAPPGVYGYQAVVRFADGREKVLSGDVTVVR